MDAERDEPFGTRPYASQPRKARSERAIVGPAAGLIRANAGALLRTAGLVALAGAVPVAILADFVSRTVGVEGGEVMPPAAVAAQGVAILVEFLLSALVLVVAFQVFSGLPRPLDMRRPVSAMGAYVVSLAAAGLPLAAAAVVAAALASVSSPGESLGVLVLVIVLVVVGVIGAFYVFASLALSMIVVIREDAPLGAALRTSWRRMPGNRLRWIGGQMVLGLLLLPVLALASLVFGWMPTFAAAMLFTALNSLASAAVIGSVATVVYRDTAPQEPVPLPGPLPEDLPGSPSEFPPL